MNAFRIVSIIISIAFVVVAILSCTGSLAEEMKWIVTVLGIITAILNVISTVMWWLTEKTLNEKAFQLRAYHISNW